MHHSVVLHAEMPVLLLAEMILDLRMAQGTVGIVDQQVLLRHIGDVFRLRVLGEEVVEGLVLPGAQMLRNGEPPFLELANCGSTSKITPRKG